MEASLLTARASICVYCGSNLGAQSSYARAAQILGESIAVAGVRLVYGGGERGLMGAVARACLDAGGEVLGVVPRFLLSQESVPSEDESPQSTMLTPSVLCRQKLKIVEDMHARKRAMFDEADAFIALPGGLGTLEELVEQMTWAQLGRHDKPIIIADIDGFWRPLLALFEHMQSHGFIGRDYPLRFSTVEKIEDAAPAVLSYLKTRSSGSVALAE